MLVNFLIKFRDASVNVSRAKAGNMIDSSFVLVFCIPENVEELT